MRELGITETKSNFCAQTPPMHKQIGANRGSPYLDVVMKLSEAKCCFKMLQWFGHQIFLKDKVNCLENHLMAALIIEHHMTKCLDYTLQLVMATL